RALLIMLSAWSSCTLPPATTPRLAAVRTPKEFCATVPPELIRMVDEAALAVLIGPLMLMAAPGVGSHKVTSPFEVVMPLVPARAPTVKAAATSMNFTGALAPAFVAANVF